MFTGQVALISNAATWQSDVNELVDDDDGTTTDLTKVASLDIEVTIKNMDSGSGLLNSSCVLATASIANGKVTVPGPGFLWQFEVADLSVLCAGTYRLGVKVTINGFVTDVIDGTLGVIEGN